MGCSLTGEWSSTICGGAQPAGGLVWFAVHRYQALDLLPCLSSVSEELACLTSEELPGVSTGELVFLTTGELVFLTTGELAFLTSVEVVPLYSLPLASFSWATYPASPVCHGGAPLPPPSARHGRPR